MESSDRHLNIAFVFLPYLWRRPYVANSIKGPHLPHDGCQWAIVNVVTCALLKLNCYAGPEWLCCSLEARPVVQGLY